MFVRYSMIKSTVDSNDDNDGYKWIHVRRQYSNGHIEILDMCENNEWHTRQYVFDNGQFEIVEYEDAIDIIHDEIRLEIKTDNKFCLHTNIYVEGGMHALTVKTKMTHADVIRLMVKL